MTCRIQTECTIFTKVQNKKKINIAEKYIVEHKCKVVK